MNIFSTWFVSHTMRKARRFYRCQFNLGQNNGRHQSHFINMLKHQINTTWYPSNKFISIIFLESIDSTILIGTIINETNENVFLEKQIQRGADFYLFANIQKSLYANDKLHILFASLSIKIAFNSFTAACSLSFSLNRDINL